MSDVILPNIRKLFVPDPGYVIYDADLSGADAQVVAWEADDADLKAAFRSGIKIHAKNAEDMFGERFTLAPGRTDHKGTPKGRLYDQCKRAIHATNYVARAITLTRTPEIGWPLNEAEGFQRKWFQKHPGILEWHRRTEHELRRGRTATNRFGYRIVYFDRLDSVLSQAVAWVPQSTVAEVTFRGARSLERACPWVELLLQVHDSLVFQVPFHRAESYSEIRAGLRVEIPYPDPLVIPWGLKKSAKSWGECEKVEG